MGRKRNYVSKITNKDMRMLLAFVRTGYLNKSMLKNDLGIAERRIQSFMRDGLLEKGIFFNQKTKETTDIFRLSEKGQKFTTKTIGVDRFYKSSSARHDLALSEKYLSLTAKEQDTWIIESEVRDIFNELLSNMRDDKRQEELWSLYENNQISSIDACYTNSYGQNVGIEIITSSYSDAEIEAKEELSDALNIETTYIKI